MKKIIAVFTIVIVLLAVFLFFVYQNIGEFLCNNTTPADELITVNYTADDFDEWLVRASNGSKVATLWDFFFNFRVECLRKTQEGYYAVLLLNDGNKAFAFFDNNLNVAYWTTGLIYDGFPTKAQMDNLLATLEQQGAVTLDRIAERVGYPLSEPFSSSTSYGYIIQEGILLLDFERVYSPDADRILASTEFVSNEDWSATLDYWLAEKEYNSSQWPPTVTYYPYILEIDKTN